MTFDNIRRLRAWHAKMRERGVKPKITTHEAQMMREIHWRNRRSAGENTPARGWIARGSDGFIARNQIDKRIKEVMGS